MGPTTARLDLVGAGDEHVRDRIHGRADAALRRLLSPRQRAAEHGAGDGIPAQPLLGAQASAAQLLTVEEYAAQDDVGVTPQTVRTWIRRGELTALWTPKGYRIAPGATRTKRARE